MIVTMRSKRGRPRHPRGIMRVLTLCCRRYRTMEAASLRLQKEAKGYLDSLRGKQFVDMALDLTNYIGQQ
jgi:hypothetical protein